MPEEKTDIFSKSKKLVGQQFYLRPFGSQGPGRVPDHFRIWTCVHHQANDVRGVPYSWATQQQVLEMHGCSPWITLQVQAIHANFVTSSLGKSASRWPSTCPPWLIMCWVSSTTCLGFNADSPSSWAVSTNAPPPALENKSLKAVVYAGTSQSLSYIVITIFCGN